MGVRLGIATAVANAVVNWAAKRAASTAPRVGGEFFPGSPIFSEWSPERAVSEGYKVSYILYAVASDMASICIRQVPWYLGRMGKDGVELVDNHPLVEMLRSPNLDDTWGGLTEKWDLFKSLAGNGYGKIVLLGDRVDVWSLRPDRMSPVADKMGRLAYWEYRVDGEPERLDPETVLHFKFFDPGSDFLGLAPLQAAARIVDASTAMVKWNAEAMANRTIPDMALTPRQSLSPEQHMRLLESLQQKMAGTKNARKTIVPSEPMDMLQLSLTPVEMDFINSFATYEAAICKAFHVHPEAVGALGATFENKEWAIRAKWEGPVMARLSEMRAVLNHKFRPMFGTSDPVSAKPGDIFLDFDLNATPLAAYKQQRALEMAQKAWACGVPWDVADATFGVGIGPVPGGDVGYISVGLLPAGYVPEDEPPANEEPIDGDQSDQGARKRARRVFNAETDAQMEMHWRSIDRRKRGWERGVANKVGGRFAEEGAKVAAAVRGGSLDLDPVVAGQRQAWEELMEAVLRAVIEDFGKATADDLAGRSAEAPYTRDRFDPWSDNTKKWVKRRATEQIDEIQATTKKELRRVIVNGLDEGWDMRRIAKAIEGVYENWEGGTGAYRAMLIARTEVHAAASFGSHESARQSGVVNEKAWLSSMDPPRAREDHMAISGEWIPFEDDYVMPDGTRMSCPGDGPAEHVISCRCVELFRSK